MTPSDLRARFRRGDLVRPTSGMAPGFVQANLVVLPRELAFDFLLFTQRNPKPCPLLEVVEAGSAEPRAMAPGADLRTDLPRYRVYRDGELVDEPTDLTPFWSDDLVSFLIGCSFTFESALHRGRHPGAARRAVHERADVRHVARRPSPPARSTARRSSRCGRSRPGRSCARCR